MGYTARTRLAERDSGTPVVQLRDVRVSAVFNLAQASRADVSGSLDRYEVKPGDVLFRSRGERNTAVLIDGSGQQSAIAILPLMVLRTKESVVPAYLAWFINQQSAQRYLDGCARGTNMRMIPRACLEELPVAVPKIETQQAIVEIARLAEREKELLTVLAEKKLARTSLALLRLVQDAQSRDSEVGRCRQAGRQ